jgi:hypothetical protein
MARRKWIVFVAGMSVLMIVGAWCVFVWIRNAEKRELWLALDVEQIGQVMVVFVDDKSRLPVSFEELLQDGYLETRTDGQLYPTRRIIGRNTGYGSGPVDRPFHDLTEITVQYDGRVPKSPIISFRGSSTGHAAHLAEVFSELLLERLHQENVRSSTRAAP